MSFKIDDETRLNFDKMLKESGASDNTAKIRKLKHSKCKYFKFFCSF